MHAWKERKKEKKRKEKGAKKKTTEIQYTHTLKQQGNSQHF